MNNKKASRYILLLFFVLSCGHIFAQEKPTKLYWFIPDGVRAEPGLFDVFGWAQQGYLPNIKKMMEHGSYGYSVPVFPSHSPVNFAVLLSGCLPHVNGVADGTMRVEGSPLNKVAVGGFRSSARRVPAVWSIMEQQGKKDFILSVPGSTPPEINNGIVVRGRRGGWGTETFALIFESAENNPNQSKYALRSKMLYQDVKLMQYLNPSMAKEWQISKASYSPPLEIQMKAYGLVVFGYIYDSTDDGKTNYDHILFSENKKDILSDLAEGDWSNWAACKIPSGADSLSTSYRTHIIKLNDDGFFRIRLLFNNINASLTQPEEIAEDLTNNIGAMVDYPDDSPAQLITCEEDKFTFQKEMQMSFDWHRNAIGFVMNTYQPDVMIHDIYTPNQMLTSRWWLGYVDPAGKWYKAIDKTKRDILWNEVKSMYLSLDSMVGEILAHTDSNTLVVFSSDHGANPLNYSININNLLAKKGYLKFKKDSAGRSEIDWEYSKAVFLKMDGIYINPKGLGGKWQRGWGAEYEKLRSNITKDLLRLKHRGAKPITSVTRWEDAEEKLNLPKDRVGDLIISNLAGYGFEEEYTEKWEVFTDPYTTGYKQAITTEKTKSLWTPFIVMGKGVKENNFIETPIKHMNQLPTILKLMGLEVPNYMQGKPIESVFKK